MLCWFIAKSMTGTSLYKMLIKFLKNNNNNYRNSTLQQGIRNPVKLTAEQNLPTAEYTNSQAKAHLIKWFQSRQKLLEKKSLRCYDYTNSGSAALASAVCQDSVPRSCELSHRAGEMMAAPLFLMTCFLFPLFTELKRVWVRGFCLFVHFLNKHWIISSSVPPQPILNMFSRRLLPGTSHSELQCCPSQYTYNKSNFEVIWHTRNTS